MLSLRVHKLACRRHWLKMMTASSRLRMTTKSTSSEITVKRNSTSKLSKITLFLWDLQVATRSILRIWPISFQTRKRAVTFCPWIVPTFTTITTNIINSELEQDKLAQVSLMTRLFRYKKIRKKKRMIQMTRKEEAITKVEKWRDRTSPRTCLRYSMPNSCRGMLKRSAKIQIQCSSISSMKWKMTMKALTETKNLWSMGETMRYLQLVNIWATHRTRELVRDSFTWQTLSKR